MGYILCNEGSACMSVGSDMGILKCMQGYIYISAVAVAVARLPSGQIAGW